MTHKIVLYYKKHTAHVRTENFQHKAKINVSQFCDNFDGEHVNKIVGAFKIQIFP